MERAAGNYRNIDARGVLLDNLFSLHFYNRIS